MSSEPVSLDLDRRSFMKATALAGAVALGGSGAGQALAQGGEDEVDGTDDDSKLTNTICNFCAVGCGFHGERKGDTFVGQEPWHDHPVNNGSLCSKGAAIFESEHSEKRLKHPLKKEGGEWKKISWDEAYSEVAGELNRIRREYGPDATMWLGSAHHSNEEAYAFRKLASIFGTNNVDHQARICHSTTVTGLANTWGYGAMTNPINDYRNFEMNLIIGQNPAEAHPIAMQHILEGQKRGGTIVSVDARFTKTSAHADEFHRIRPGTDVALMMGLIRYIKEQGELNTEFIEKRVQGWPDVEAELDRYDLETVAEITWISPEEIRHIGDLMIENKPNVQIEWAMGGTQHNNGTQNIRSYALSGLATGGIAREGGGMQVMRGHANVQGATDLGVASHILPGYYSVSSPASWRYWTDIWTKSPFTSGSLSLKQLHGRFDKLPKEMYKKQSKASSAFENAQNIDARSLMFQKGLTVARWSEAALPKKDRLQETPVYQQNPVKAAIYWGHSSNSISEMPKMKKALENLDLLVVVDLFPSLTSVLPDRDDGVVILPASSQYEHYRSVTNSHRAVQWSEPVSPPAHNSRPDMRILQELAARLGHGDHFDWGDGDRLYSGKSTYEDCLREVNLGVRTIGYQQSPERLQRQHEYADAFSTETLKAEADGLPVSGEYWQLPWPCWGKGHPGTPILWRDSLDPREGGQDFRARWGVKAPTPEEWKKNEYNENKDESYPLKRTFEQGGQEALSMTRGSYSPKWADGTIRGVPEYPGFTTALPENLEEPDALSIPYKYAFSPDKSVYDTAKKLNQQKEYDFDLEFYKQYDHKQPDPPTGRGRARGVAWNFIDKVPVHREPIESPYPRLAEQWPANGKQKNFYRLDQNNAKTQQEATRRANEQGLDIVMTSGRQVEHQGGGAESRSNVFLADLQPHMYAELSPGLAEEKGIEGGDMVVVQTTDRGSVLVKARVTDRVTPPAAYTDGESVDDRVHREVFLPFHWGGVFQGKSLRDQYPDGHVPYAIGDSVNAITVRGYDAETQMQETKVALVNVEKATQDLIDELDMEFVSFPQDEEGIGLQKKFDVRDFHTVQ